MPGVLRTDRHADGRPLETIDVRRDLVVPVRDPHRETPGGVGRRVREQCVAAQRHPTVGCWSAIGAQDRARHLAGRDVEVEFAGLCAELNRLGPQRGARLWIEQAQCYLAANHVVRREVAAGVDGRERAVVALPIACRPPADRRLLRFHEDYRPRPGAARAASTSKRTVTVSPTPTVTHRDAVPVRRPE